MSWVRLQPYFQLMRWHRPGPILLLLWPTYWGLFLGELPSLKSVLVFTIGVLLMRSAGCVMNDYCDRGFDRRVLRTQNRPLAKETCSTKQAIGLLLILLSASASLLFFLSLPVMGLAGVALSFAFLYPLAKRVTYFPQAVLGLAFNFGLIMAYQEVNHHLAWSVWFWYGWAVVWTLLYDTEYALVDYPDDCQIGVKSPVVFFKERTPLFLGCLTGVLLSLLLCGMIVSQGSPLRLTVHFLLWIAIAMIWMRHLLLLAKPGSFRRGLTFFGQQHWVGLLIWVWILMDHL